MRISRWVNGLNFKVTMENHVLILMNVLLMIGIRTLGKQPPQMNALVFPCDLI